jgi:hypothetical protein
MSFNSEKLLTELDQPRIIDWAVELKNRKDGFAFLMEAVRGDRLNHNQFLNALHMLFRMAFPENASEVLQTFVDLAAHPDITIRSEAVQLAIGLLRTSTNLKTPLLFSDAQETSVVQAMTRGLTMKVANLAQEFFAI